MNFLKLLILSAIIFNMTGLTYAGGANRSCYLPEEITSIEEMLEGLSVSLNPTEKVEVLKGLDYELTPEVIAKLMNGTLVYSQYKANDKNIPDELKAIFEREGASYSDKEKGGLPSNAMIGKGRVLSFSKVSYFVPGKKASDFTLDKTKDPAFIEKTTIGVKPVEAKKGGLRTAKAIPLIGDVETEFETTEDQSGLSKGKLVTKSDLIDTSSGQLESAFSVTHYQDVPGKGVIVTTFEGGTLNTNWLARKAIYNFSGTSTFEDEHKHAAKMMAQ